MNKLHACNELTEWIPLGARSVKTMVIWHLFFQNFHGVPYNYIAWFDTLRKGSLIVTEYFSEVYT